MKRIIFLVIFLAVSQLAFSAQVDTIKVRSAAMKTMIKNVVISPEGKGNVHYPVLYLLHGAFGDYSSWIKNAPNIKQLVDQHKIIVICPEGGFNSWYFDSPIDPKFQYETYIMRELITYIDQHYKTLPDRAHRAIAGLSMGGHGAFYLGIRHQETFGAIGAMSGGLDIRPFATKWDISKRIGTIEQYPDRWESRAVINMVDQLIGTDIKIIMDCGDEDFFYGVNKAVHRKLMREGVPHDFTIRPGGHNWKYWSNSIEYQMLFFDRFFRKKG
ncbi:alpha/beta hydrolase family protein [Persicobacter psychrovividus]|uniref:Esterase n=1 Tax=Persicobacter psychrovividus TaxID=387638 RepID=A0ABM7VKI1_9BACT|nr:esterase [Persicobacter psychrovividus]